MYAFPQYNHYSRHDLTPKHPTNPNLTCLTKIPLAAMEPAGTKSQTSSKDARRLPSPHLYS